IDHHAAKGAAELSDLIVPAEVNLMIKVSRIPYQLRGSDEFGERLGNGVRSSESDHDAEANCYQSGDQSYDPGPGTGTFIVLLPLLQGLVCIVIGNFECIGGGLDPCAG